MKFREVCPKELFPILMILESHSDDNYLVGGAVRDLLTNKIPKDWDIVTDIKMDILIDLFEGAGFRVKQTGVAHFVLNVYNGDFGVEVSNFRKDVVCNGRQAEVEVGNIVEDAHRRDFYINSLYINTRTQKLLDPTGEGIADIRARRLRFVGEPKRRIREDYLRCVRFYRFAHKGFTPDKKHLKTVREMWNEAYERTTAERMRNEIEKMINL